MMYVYGDCNYEDWYIWNNKLKKYIMKYVIKLEQSDCVRMNFISFLNVMKIQVGDKKVFLK